MVGEIFSGMFKHSPRPNVWYTFDDGPRCGLLVIRSGAATFIKAVQQKSEKVQQNLLKPSDISMSCRLVIYYYSVLHVNNIILCNNDDPNKGAIAARVTLIKPIFG